MPRMFLSLCAALLIAGCAGPARFAPEAPIGIKRFAQVDSGLARGSKPDAYGVASLAGSDPSWALLGLELVGVLVAAPVALTVLGFWTEPERRALGRLVAR